ncbi:NCS2 family permease [Cohnella yongneupensis]|uniref:NCS2 family permease n=1 Tax=Cohnella yongneupensis TaxID=425006 RepID=A0ABW0R2L9_9BACL
MERFFKLKERGSNVRTELMAGLTTFMTMAYILAVNPDTLSHMVDGVSQTGGEWYPIFLATALAAGIFTILMGIFVNFPVALAPGMGLNAYFATVILSSAATGKPVTFEIALTAVFISGLIFILLTVTKIRQMLIVAMPDSLKHAITVGIGLFISIIGLKNSGLLTVGVETNPFVSGAIEPGKFTDVKFFETVFHMGSLEDHGVQLVLIGLALISILMVLRVKGAILFGILGTTIIGILMGSSYVPTDINTDLTPWIPELDKVAFANFDWDGVMSTGLISIVATFTFVELFDTFGTLVGTASRAGLMQDPVEGQKRVGKAMMVDAVAVSGGALLGTSTTTAYVESAAGVAEGGRTGLTSVATGTLFLAALFIAPIIKLIPGSASAAALIIVGLLMLQSVKHIDFQDYTIAIPSFLTIVLMPFTYNIANGISFGIVTYVILATLVNLFGKGKYKVHWLMWILAILVVARYAFIGSQG